MEIDNFYTHIYPLNDIEDHNLVDAICKCNPTISEDIVIHYAFDGRDILEAIEENRDEF